MILFRTFRSIAASPKETRLLRHLTLYAHSDKVARRSTLERGRRTLSVIIGTQLGSHEITALLGRGGMGEVYRARDIKLKREVAIKILPDEFSRDADRVSRFQREAEVLASLNHPNIAAIYDLQEADGSRYLVLELVEGETLAGLLAKRGALPVDEALNIGKQICDALEAAHEKGVIHRDLKPANVMVTSGGRVKVLDFGLAKLNEDTPAEASSSVMPTKVSSLDGPIIGTVAYMSPEQAEGRPVDQRSDNFSFGVLLYEMATGKQPFTGDTNISLLLSVIRDTPPPVTDVNRALPRELSRIVKRCLAKKPQQRYQTAVDLRNDLEKLKQELDARARAGRPGLAPGPIESGKESSPIVFASPLFQRVLDQVRAVASADATVLIRGESGVGKELIARHIHDESPRRAHPFVKLDCAAIPRDAFESELFGCLADGGTLFVDHIEEIPSELQAKLMRPLQDSTFQRVGDNSVYRADVRFIAATSRDLTEQVSQGRFRRDLYFRLSVFPIEIPPLRSRPEDIPVLVEHFLTGHAAASGRRRPHLTEDQVRRLQTYDWPGNVRELKNVVERAVLLAGEGPLRFDEALPSSAFSYPARAPLPEERTPARGFLTVKEFEQAERNNLVAAMEAAAWRVSGTDGAAAQLGMTAARLKSRLKTLGVQKPESASLYMRLGSSRGIAAFARDLLGRAIAHPQLRRFWNGRSTYGVLREEKLLVAYLSSAAGGPIQYVGRDMKSAHRDLRISSSDWQTFRAILNETLEALRVPTPERQEVLELVERLRADIVES
jgi:DNA-binding NtrC family response regulator